MKKYKKILSFIIFIILLLLAVLLFYIIFSDNVKLAINNTYIKLYGEPISDDGVINNKFFNINNEGKNAKATTKGINNAIEYASENNINYLKLEKGTYLINGVGKYYEEKGIVLKSNITLDLNGSIIKHEAVSDIRYSIITIFEAENVEIKNGIIEGDKSEHDYDSIESTHEYGYGIELRGAKSTKLYNLNINNLTGDGILISEMESSFSVEKTDNLSEDIYIFDCDISHNRRQGISIIDASNVYIYNNEIHDIKGTAPQCAIDIEPNLKTEKVNNVYIHDNKFYKMANEYAIKTEGGTYHVEIYGNSINGGLLIASAEDKIDIYNNIIENGKLDITLTDYNKNIGYHLNSVKVKNNDIKQTNVNISRINQVLLEDNIMNGSNINIENCNNAIFLNNDMKSESEQTFKYNIGNESSKIHYLYLYNNNGIERYKTEIENTELLEIIRDINQINNYIENNF